MLDKRTFGSTPAAIFLVDRLNALNDAKQTHRVSSCINAIKKLINEAIEMHTDHGMSTKLLYFIVDKIAADVTETANDMIKGTHGITYDQTVVNLMVNVLRGQVKSIKRRLAQVVNIHNRQKRELLLAEAPKISKTKNGIVIGKIEYRATRVTIAKVVDHTNEFKLRGKSRRRLAKRNLSADHLK